MAAWREMEKVLEVDAQGQDSTPLTEYETIVDNLRESVVP